MEMGERIRKLRKENGLTQTELAAKVQTTKQNIYKYEKGIITNIPLDKIKALAEALNTTVAYLIGWDEPTSLEWKVLNNFSQLDKRSRKLFLDYAELLLENPDKISDLSENSIENQLEQMKQSLIMWAIADKTGVVTLESADPVDINILSPEMRTLIETQVEEERQKLLAEREAENSKNTNVAPNKSMED